jgi:hypothetical protein
MIWMREVFYPQSFAARIIVTKYYPALNFVLELKFDEVLETIGKCHYHAVLHWQLRNGKHPV